MKPATMLIIITTAVTITLSFPVMRRSTTLCPHGVDPRPLHCKNVTGSNDTAGNDSTIKRTGNATERHVWTYYPFPYDPKLGWYTAAVISGLILTFLLYEGMERAKHALVDRWEAR